MRSPSALENPTLQPARLRAGHFRWYIAGLLMLATTISYLDRTSLSVAITSPSLDISNEAYSIMLAAFMTAYAVMQPVAGWLIDRLGTRRGLSISVIFWSLANMAHAFARGLWSFAALRFLLGVGESGNYPGAIKAVSEWFPARERALATGIFNIGSGTGAVIAAPLVAGIILMWGWQAAFVITGATGFLWVIAWLALYHPPEQHPRVSPAELALIRAGREDHLSDGPRVTGVEVLRHKEIWAVMAAKFFSDPVWYFYLFWLPKFLKSEHGFDLAKIALFAWMPYVCADVGSVLGGMLSTGLSRGRISVIGARKLAMCICACLMPVAIPAGRTHNAYLALACICIATFGHQCWSASLLTLPADLFPPRLVGYAYGLAGMCGIIGGGLFMILVGYLLQSLGYVSMFTAVGFLHPLATLIVVLLVRPRAMTESRPTRASPDGVTA